MYLHLLLILLLPLPLPSLQQQRPSDDLGSLLEFKKGIRHDPSGKVLATWTPPAPGDNAQCPTSWYGVTCNVDGDVVSVSLDGLGLSGDVKFSTLTGMRSLQSLSLSRNNLTGRLVPVLGSMSSIQRLDLSENMFYGPIPGRIVELSGLNYLNLSGNGFEGAIPSRIRMLEQLRVIDLRGNKLWGDVGAMLSEFRNAEHVDLSGNELFGELRLPLENFSRLADTVQHMNLSWNRINGRFFSAKSMSMFRNLLTLDVSHNEINGELPTFDGFLNLRVFRAAGNRLRGSLPQELFGNSMPLVDIDLSGNEFSGPVFSINSTSLRFLNLSSNALSGQLPSSVGTCIKVDLSRNELSGDLIAMHNWGAMLEVVDLSSNQLSGNFLNDTSQFPALISVRMSNNSLDGALMFDGHQSLSIFDLSLNNLTGPLPSALFTSASLTYMNLSQNYFTDAIPIQSPHSSLSRSISMVPLLEYVDLSDNLLSGSLPPDIVSFQKLIVLAVRKNYMSGEIPNELGQLKYLEVLDLSYNSFSGKLPSIPQSSLRVFNVSYNDLSGSIPESLLRFPDSSFHPGNTLLRFPVVIPPDNDIPSTIESSGRQGHHLRSRIRLAIIVGVVGAVVLIFFISVIVHRMQSQEVCGKKWLIGQSTDRALNIGGLAPDFFQAHKNGQLSSSLNFTNDHLMSDTHGMPAQKGLEADNHGHLAVPVGVSCSESDRLGMLSSPFSSSPQLGDSNINEQPEVLHVYSPDRLVGKLFFVDSSLVFTAENLSRAPAEILGRSSHGTSYKATLESGHMLTVKWLRVGLVKHKKDFAKEVKKIGTIRHPNVISLRCFYWGPREQERLLISDFVVGDSLALHLYESTPRRYSRLTFRQRLKISIDIARCLCFLHHDKCLPHGNLKPTNILLSGPDLTAQVADYGLHRLMTLKGTCEQMLNLGALGYRAPELANVSKPCPTFKSDVYAFGIIVMELLTRRSAGDIISGQSGAVDLPDWVQMCSSEGRGTDCYDRDIAGIDEAPRAMDELLAISLRCTLPVNERPDMKTIFEDLCAITI